RFCMADASGKHLNYAQALSVSVSLSNIIKSLVQEEKCIGIMLPPSIGSVLGNIAVSLLNKIPVNLNYTTSREAMGAIIEQCSMQTILTSRKFIEKTGFSLPGKVIFMEDLFGSISGGQMAMSFFKSYCFPREISHRFVFGKNNIRAMGQLATIMFTSGSTGHPKGVQLTHANIVSNLEGLYQVFHVRKKDVVMGILPQFHSFGFTANMWFPLVAGIGAVYHYNPLDAKMIGQLVQRYQASILMATPTFLSGMSRRCSQEQLRSLRIVVVGAEKLKKEITEQFRAKFGIEPMEGYGCTELSPIVSINLPDYHEQGVRQKSHKREKIGLPLPGVAVKILNQESLQPVGANEDGLLYVKGPNVMQGYLHQDALTRDLIREGWYQTGDIANMDEDGFLTITDRVSRFSKIGGEMVPHIKIEEAIQEILETSELVCAVTSVPDERKGEKLAVLCLQDVDVISLVDQLKACGLPNLWIPAVSQFISVPAVPLLGTGKVDLGRVKQIAHEHFQMHQK
ncbi:MAG: AMP-binding protein, partial [Candidatus Omnitrophica bacterium]|nr:AMP-binding protein [Candidatus Omnitrophota bacterium]